MHDGQLLMLRLARDPWAGSWDIPGGFCLAGEHPITTVMRTVAEELGLAIQVTGYLGAWRGTYPRAVGRPEQVDTLALCYHAVPVDIVTLRPDATSVREARWFPPGGLPHDLAFPAYLGPVLQAWSDAMRLGQTITPLPDRPQ